MMRTVLAATNSANRISTAATINPTIPASSLADERRGAPDLHHVHALARLDDAILVVATRRPHLAVDPHPSQSAVVVDALGDDPGAADERRRSRADLWRHVHVAAGDRPDDREADGGEHRERDPADRGRAAREVDQRGPRGADRKREKGEAEVDHLGDGEDDR